MADNEKARNLQLIQVQTLTKYLSSVKNEDIFQFSKKIFPVISSQQPCLSLYFSIKKQVLLSRTKGAIFDEISSQLLAKAYSVSDMMGDQMSSIFQKQPEFLSRFQTFNNHNNNSLPVVQQSSNILVQQEKKQTVNNDVNENIISDVKEGGGQKIPPNPPKSPVQQNFVPFLAPMRNQYNSNSPLLEFNQQHQELNDSSTVYKIGFKNQEQKNKNNLNGHIPTENNKSYQNKQTLSKDNENKPARQVIQVQKIIEAPQSSNLKKKNDAERILTVFGDPFSSGRPATTSPVKPMYSPAHLFQQKISQIPVKNSQKSYFFSTYQQQKSKNTKIIDKFVVDSNLIRNLSNMQLCVCQTPCQNIVLSEDSFLCVHCQYIYHTRCMKKTKESKNCSFCHLRLMIPNKVACQQLFVGLMKKGKKKHDLLFELSEQIVTFLRSKKDCSHRLQIRCFRLNQKTQNQNLFPDSCTLSINGKQLKQFKPLHKQSSLKYRKDEPISILKNFHIGQNKITVTEFHAISHIGNERIQPEDHLIGLYIVEEQQLNATVERITHNYTTTLQQSRNILNKSFYINEQDKSADQMSQSEAISCQVLKIPLTCALTTEKLNYPARGIFCQHFQCFDLKNFIMMTSSSSNPRWVCPICKAPCYEFKIDCILTEILKQYTGCNKVQTLVLYKNGIYEILDKDQDPIDIKGNKLKQSLQRNISDLKIVDSLKRQREKEAQKQMLKQQEAEKKKKKLIQLPPEDQIVSLLSDSEGMV